VKYLNIIELKCTLRLNWRRVEERISSPAKVTTCVDVMAAEEVIFIIGSSNIYLTVGKYQNIILTLISRRIPIPQIMEAMRLNPQKAGI
jgi:hypothetical protein